MHMRRGRSALSLIAATAVLLSARTPRTRDFKLSAQTIDSPAPAGARVPELRRLGDGSALMSWLEPRAGGAYAFRMAIRHAEA